MSKYKLSTHITVADIEDDYDTPIPADYRKDHFILNDEARDKEFVINGTIKYFIDKFSTPKSLAELISEVESEVNSNDSEIAKTCTSFFEFLCKKNILVPGDKHEEIIAAEPFLKPEDVFENFKVEKLLSDRGYLEIYLVTDNKNESHSVIKLLNPDKVKDDKIYNGELYELEREYKMMKSVEHIDAMCQVYSFKKTAQYAFINLEYIEGLSILRFLRNTDGLTNQDCLKIIHDILIGFGAMHESGLIHGDIHSSNILITETKNVRIIDLGYARKIDLQENEVLPFGGVLHYMPPERISISNLKKFVFDADLYSDVYQIGMLMYLVLYKDFPFNGFTWEDLAKSIKENKEEYPELSFLVHPVSGGIKNIIQKCLAKNPAERYKNAGEVLKDFKNHAPQKELIVN